MLTFASGESKALRLAHADFGRSWIWFSQVAIRFQLALFWSTNFDHAAESILLGVVLSDNVLRAVCVLGADRVHLVPADRVRAGATGSARGRNAGARRLPS